MHVSDQVSQFKNRCENDTGYICRHVLGHNYDEQKDLKTGLVTKFNVGTGGVRATGPHAEMVAFLDSTDSYIMMQAPRGSLKSTEIQGLVVRSILQNPNIRIALGMDVMTNGKEKVLAIRNQLEFNEKIQKYWGPQRGSRWDQERFTVAGRTQLGLQEPTLTLFATDAPLVGGHYDIVICDDLVHHGNITEVGLAKTWVIFQKLSPLLVQGGRWLVVGTRYHDGDLYGTIERDLPQFEKLIMNAGVTVEKDSATNQLSLKGTPLFEHITIERLNHELGIGYDHFMTQYMNEVPVGVNQPFTRDMFGYERLQALFLSEMSAYILTDTATTAREEACYSVIAYIGLDQPDNAYLLDLRVGHWHVHEFEAQFFQVLDKWEGRVNHIGETFEKIALNTVFMAGLQKEAIRRRRRLNLIQIPRTGQEQRKEQRIRRLMSRFSNGRFFVTDGVPRTFVDLDRVKLLYDRESYVEEGAIPLPGGELVDEFVRFPRYPKNDIADAIADIDAMMPDGTRFCFWRKRRSWPRTPSGQADLLGYDPDNSVLAGDWWTQTYNETFSKASPRNP